VSFQAKLLQFCIHLQGDQGEDSNLDSGVLRLRYCTAVVSYTKFEVQFVAWVQVHFNIFPHYEQMPL
jgi:hypothetical protein